MEDINREQEEGTDETDLGGKSIRELLDAID